jgi:PAS domain S-box-containing protein
MTTTAAEQALSPKLPDSLAQDIVNEWKESILVLDWDLLIKFANKSFCSWIGLEWSKVVGQSLQQLLTSREVSDFLRGIQRGSTLCSLQADCDIPGVGKRTLLLGANPLVHPEQKALLLSIQDITDQNLSDNLLSRKVEVAERSDKLQRREADLLRSIMESSGDGIFVADAAGNCVLWNTACEKMLGVKPDTIPQAEWTEGFGIYLPDQVTLFPGEDLPLARALRGETCDDVELWIKNTVQKGIWISVTASPLKQGQDGAVSTFRDITFAKKVDTALAAKAEEVSRSNRELEQFAYVAAHDLQEPLRMVSSYVQLLARRYKGKLDSEADEFITFATEGAKRMSQLINDLLSFSRIGRGEVAEQMVDCEKILESVILSLTLKKQTARAQVTHSPLPKILANELQITQVFQNLIDNAIKFRSKEDPRVHISAREDGDKWIFSVADNGIGIDAEYKDRIFVIFQRLNARENYDGTGIGLAVCKKIVEKRSGNIWVEPNQGHGTVVYFTWP